jgi:hypothetical protein
VFLDCVLVRYQPFFWVGDDDGSGCGELEQFTQYKSGSYSGYSVRKLRFGNGRRFYDSCVLVGR